MARGGIVSIRWDDAAIKMSAENPAGAVGRAMRQLADQCAREMKRLCPVAPHDRPGPVPGHPLQGPPRRSGTLRSSIRIFRQPGGSYLIGPTDQIAPGVFLGPLIERGTRPHIIRSHGPWPLYSAATGQRYGRPVWQGTPGRKHLAYWEVRHPGTAPHPFIREAADRMNGTRIVIRLGGPRIF